jgi:hypothetical protein
MINSLPPLWGRARVGGIRSGDTSLAPTLALPHKGGGNKSNVCTTVGDTSGHL